jgi:hypothetical protein
MNPRMHGRYRATVAVLSVSLCALAACAGGTTAAARDGMQGTAGDTLLEGAFRWTTLNEQPAPVEFPAGSGATLVAGALELRGLSEAIRAGAGRFGLRFTLRPAGDTARVTGQDGRFRVVGDSLLFTPDGLEQRPPVRFRYAWRSGGVLALTDAQGHVWGYVRQ